MAILDKTKVVIKEETFITLLSLFICHPCDDINFEVLLWSLCHLVAILVVSDFMFHCFW